MQLNSAIANGMVTNINNSKEFGISSNSSKLFAMLSTSLYSNKERAVLYEIGANCVDAHALNGNQDRPFELSIPTRLDSNIRFRDFGPGLDESSVYSLLTTYGESTKADSNDFIGAYGIGSKSPAAVTSTWNVISTHQGVEKEYMVFIDGRGVPSLTKIREQESDNDSGIEVIIPVNPNNAHEWTSEIPNVFKHYKVKPIIKNGNINFPVSPEPKISGNGWKFIRQSQSYYNSINLTFITTQRAYIADKQTLRNAFSDEPFAKMLEFNMEIDFPVGSIETSLSREQMQYTRYTMGNIKARLTEVYDEFKQIVDAKLESATTKLEYCTLAFSVASEIWGNHVSNILPYIEGNKFGVVNENQLRQYTIKAKSFDGIFVSDGGNKISQMKNGFTCFKNFSITSESNYKDSTANIHFRISNLNQVKIVRDDVKNSKARVRAWCKNYYTMIIPVVMDIPSDLNSYVSNASELLDPPKVVRGQSDKVKKSKLWNLRANSLTRVDEDRVQGMIDDGADILVFKFKDSRDLSTIDNLDFRLAKFYEKHHVNVFGVKEGDDIPEECTNIQEYAKQDFDERNTAKFIDAHVLTQEAFKTRSYYVDFNQIMRKDIRTDDDSIWNNMKAMFKQLYDSYDETGKVVSSYSYVSDLASIMNLKLATGNTVMTFDSIKEKVYNTYPMLKYTDGNTPESDLINYITLTGV